MKRKTVSLMLVMSMMAAMAAGCGSSSDSTASSSTSGNSTASTETGSTDKKEASGDGQVYYLNFKPEQDEQWQDLAKAYTDETGVPVTVITAADGTYEQTLKSEMAKSEAPTLFQVNGPVGLANWKDYCYDLSGSELYKDVKSDDFVLKDGDAVQGIAYVIETYGLIYNKAILNDYCTMDNAVISSPDEINNFATLKAVADDICLAHLLPQVWILPLTGDSRHILQTFRSTMNTKLKESTRQTRSKELTLTITDRSGIYI